jgi:sec-independent protein translocase protein TatC
VSDVDDEIEASRAPLLDHLIELRQRLINCIAALFIAFIFCYIFSKQAYTFLLHPFDIASGLLAARAQDAHQSAPHGFSLAATIAEPFAQAKDMFLVLSGAKAAPASVPGGVTQLIATGPLEQFYTYLKLSALGAVALSFPVLAQQVYAFVAPGLYKRERRAFLPFLVASPVLFILGALLVYYVILPFVLWFSLSQQIVNTTGISVKLMPKVTEYFDLVTTLLLAFGLCFQMPVIVTWSRRPDQFEDADGGLALCRGGHCGRGRDHHPAGPDQPAQPVVPDHRALLRLHRLREGDRAAPEG